MKTIKISTHIVKRQSLMMKFQFHCESSIYLYEYGVYI